MRGKAEKGQKGDATVSPQRSGSESGERPKKAARKDPFRATDWVG